jgi:hypothetical protein
MSDHKPVRPKPGSHSGASDDMSGQSSIPAEQDTLQAEGSLDPGLQAYIGQQLRTVYDEVLNEAIPDRLIALLQELERKQAGQS